ncbi:MAG: hypothetical protein Q7V20_17090 [Aquabacterium sp.]|uniref:hypothetical protein n=1 Tax=Aquabacterium sp. TaxID=1872578 RepID=UPI00272777E6|nr:hypothetical protein [Aquabacterium sp.]MDO9005162.1 hypothetical protein [Aquabacterium sp.]
MKFSFKPLLVAAAAFVVGSATHAASGHDWTLTSGNISLAFSHDGYSSIRAAGGNLSTPATTPVVPGLGNPGSVNTAKLNKVTTHLDLPLTSGSTTGDSLISLVAKGSLLQIKRGFEDDEGFMHLWSVFLTNWEVDLPSSTVYAEMHTSKHQSSAVNLGRVAVFHTSWLGEPNIDSEGQIVLDTTNAQGQSLAHASGNLNGVLRLDRNTADLILVGMGLPTAPDENVVRLFHDPHKDWGTLSFTANLTGTPTVPEPSDFALVGAGMLALWATQRSSRKA